VQQPPLEAIFLPDDRGVFEGVEPEQQRVAGWRQRRGCVFLCWRRRGWEGQDDGAVERAVFGAPGEGGDIMRAGEEEGAADAVVGLY